MKDKKFIPFWMEKPKIEIIEAYAECIHNGEVLLERIEKAVKYIENNKPYWEEWHYDGADIDIESDINYIYNILKGEEKENE